MKRPPENFQFFTALHQPADAKHFDHCLISISRLRDRRGPFQVGPKGEGRVIVDSQGFTALKKHGRYVESVTEYAAHLRRIHSWIGASMVAAVSQDYMCEPEILAVTGLTVTDHQRLTIERYDALVAEDVGAYIMPVLQGYSPQEYVSHIRQYGSRLKRGMWVGVGSVCKRNTDIDAIEAVFRAINRERPDLKLHGFGVKKTALKSLRVRGYLKTADSMAWSYHARKNGRNANDWKEAASFRDAIHSMLPNLPQQLSLLLRELLAWRAFA